MVREASERAEQPWPVFSRHGHTRQPNSLQSLQTDILQGQHLPNGAEDASERGVLFSKFHLDILNTPLVTCNNLK